LREARGTPAEAWVRRASTQIAGWTITSWTDRGTVQMEVETCYDAEDRPTARCGRGGHLIVAGSGVLYVVATPIGNMGDISARAREILAGVGAVAAEDTRHSGRLLRELGLERPLISLHEHNERARIGELVARLRGGESIALIRRRNCPGATPATCLSRRGRGRHHGLAGARSECRDRGAVRVGAARERFAFEGFLPARAAAPAPPRRTCGGAAHALRLYEAPHRIAECLDDPRAARQPPRLHRAQITKR
jgi:16S rRNA (cytidine(1402)-2'-O)-methyltransferase